LGLAVSPRLGGRRRPALRTARDEADAGSAGAQADGAARDEVDAGSAGAQADGGARGDDGAQSSGAQAEAEASSTGAMSKSSAAETSRGVSRPDTSAEVAGNLGR
ncbi:hypothetical protein, partial [Gordonia sp. UBA6683]|uniref:hypothetical protein n=1 Tax=Gordonia sp. UBA6683 TaxID=1946577 RepID=UPI0025C38FDF